MTLPELRDILTRITYKPHMRIVLHQDGYRPYLQVHYDGNGEYGTAPWTGSKWMVSPHMTVTEVVSRAFLAYKAAEEHELRELFKYKTVAVFGPHFDVEQIVELVQSGQLGPDVRANALQGA